MARSASPLVPGIFVISSAEDRALRRLARRALAFDVDVERVARRWALRRWRRGRTAGSGRGRGHGDGRGLGALASNWKRNGILAAHWLAVAFCAGSNPSCLAAAIAAWSKSSPAEVGDGDVGNLPVSSSVSTNATIALSPLSSLAGG